MAEANWIKLNRKIWDCFIWSFDNPQYTLAWIDMLLLANYKDKRIMFDGVVETVPRGSFITSMVKLSERWHMNRKTVKRFLDILQSDGMITYECTRRRTSITIVNYSLFQSISGDESEISEPDKTGANDGATSGTANGTQDGTSERTPEPIANTAFAGVDSPSDGQLNGPANGQSIEQPDGHHEYNSPDISSTTLWTQHKNIKEGKEDQECKESYNSILSQKNPETENQSSSPVPYEKIKDLYNEICKSYPRCNVMSDARKKSIKARFNRGYTLEDFKNLFTKAEASSFLKGKNDRNWRASMDWILKDANMAKVLDGNYDDREPTRNSYEAIDYGRPEDFYK